MENPDLEIAVNSSEEEVSTLEKYPEAVYELLAPKVQEAIRNVPPDVWEMTEDELIENLFGKEKNVKPTEAKIRLAFWREFDRATTILAHGRMKFTGRNRNVMKSANFCRGICSQNYFHLQFLTDPMKVAWMMKPPPAYAVEVEELLQIANAKTRAILQMPLYQANGNPNIKLCEVIARIRHELEMRVKGGVVQRTQTRSENLNVNLNGKAPDGSQLPAGSNPASSPEDLDRRISELQAQMARIGLPPGQTQVPVITAGEEEVPEVEYVEVEK